MNTKKKPERFTIQFDANIPNHQEAMNTLNEAGRSKATLIAEAIHIKNAFYAYKTSAFAELFINTKHETSPTPQQTQSSKAPQKQLEVTDIHPLLPIIETHDTPSINQSEDAFWESINDSLELFNS